MAFFAHPRLYASSEPNFSGLFRLTNDFDNCKGQSPCQGGRCLTQQQHIPIFSPKFDVRETEVAFELHGELPGVEKENVHIEFTDPQIIMVRGKVERSYTSVGKPISVVEDRKIVADNDEPALIYHEDQSHETASNASRSSRTSFQATVEDDPEEDDGRSQTATDAPTPATTVAETAKPEAAGKQAAHTPNSEKYWVSERSVGDFTRTFSFPSRVQHEAVKASLDNGILTVTVPKAMKHERRRIAIN